MEAQVFAGPTFVQVGSQSYNLAQIVQVTDAGERLDIVFSDGLERRITDSKAVKSIRDYMARRS